MNKEIQNIIESEVKDFDDRYLQLIGFPIRKDLLNGIKKDFRSYHSRLLEQVRLICCEECKKKL